MLMPDGLRQEEMPLMVYYLCKFIASGDYTEEEVVDYITSSMVSGYGKIKATEKNNPIVNVIGYSRDLFFVTDNNKGTLVSKFNKSELESPEDFSYSIIKRLELDEDNKFNKMMEWLVSENRNPLVFSKYSDVLNAMPIKGIDENMLHGFAFWAEFLGVINMSGSGGKRKLPFDYALDSLLCRFLDRHEELKEQGAIPVREFMSVLSNDIYFIPMCIKGNHVMGPLSQAVRIVEQVGRIKLTKVSDTGDIWHLTPSNIFRNGNDFSNIEVL